jgi:preprotein translocase subunit YajC
LNTLLTILAQEGGQQAPPPGSGLGAMAPMFLIILIFIVFMVFMSRSRKRQEADHKKMVEAIEPGTRVMLNSGLIAKVDKIDAENQEARLIVDEEKKVHSTYNLLAIAKVFDAKTSSVKKEE